MQHNFHVFAVTLLLLLVGQDKRVLGSEQKVIFYEDAACAGRNETITDHTDKLEESWVTNATSSRIFGSWKLTMYKPVEEVGMRWWVTVTVYGQPPRGLCVEKISWPVIGWVNYTLSFANRFGQREMTSPEITFFSDTMFNGLRYAANGSAPELTPRPLAMQSVLMSSNKKWLAYPEKDFGGVPTCFCPLHPWLGVEQGEDSLSANLSITTLIPKLVVASVREAMAMDGCDCYNLVGGSAGGSPYLQFSFLTFVAALFSATIFSNPFNSH